MSTYEYVGVRLFMFTCFQYLFCTIIIITIVNRAEVDKSSRCIAEIELLIIVLIN